MTLEIQRAAIVAALLGVVSGVSVTSWADLNTQVANAPAGTTLTISLPSNGILNASAEGHVVIDDEKNILLQGNGCALDGGGKKSFFWLEGGASLRLSGPMILRNGSTDESMPWLEGGAVRVTEGHIYANMVTFESNMGNINSYGGAVSLWADLAKSKSTGTFTDCTFTSNFASNYGGAVSVRTHAAAIFSGCTFSGNGFHDGEITQYGGAINAERSSSIVLAANCSFSNDQAAEGGAISGFVGSFVDFEECSISDDEIAFNHEQPVLLTQPLTDHLTISQCNASGAYRYGKSSITVMTDCCKASKLPKQSTITKFFEDEVWRTTFIIAVIMCIGTAFAARYYYTRNEKARHHSDLDLPEPPHRSVVLSRFALRTKRITQSMHPTNCCCFSFGWRVQFPLARQASSVDKPWLIKHRQLKFKECIGSGAFGTVYNGRYGETKNPVAIKRIELNGDPDEYRKELAEAQAEMQLLWELRHPNIITFFGTSFVREKGIEIMCLVTELCIGSMDVYIGSAKKKERALRKGMPQMTKPLLMKLMQQTAAAIAHLHSKSVIHRDLKPHVRTPRIIAHSISHAPLVFYSPLCVLPLTVCVFYPPLCVSSPTIDAARRIFSSRKMAT
jgi:predicted outer membrane repeat protein